MPGELCERLLDVHPWGSGGPNYDSRKKDKIHTDGLQACMRHFRLGTMDIEQIDGYFVAECGSALGTQPYGNNLDCGRAEVIALLNTIPQVTQAPGGTQAQQTTRLNQQMAQMQRLAVIEAILVTADVKRDPYDTPVKLRAGLGLAPIA